MSSILEFRYFDDTNTSVVANYVADIYTAAGVILAGATGVAITELAPGRYRVTNPGTETGHHTLHVRASADNSLLTPPLDYTLRNDATAHYPVEIATFNRLGTPAGASIAADIAAVKTDTGNLVTRITSTLFTGITSLAQWLGLLAGKQVGNSTARTEIRATGAGSGTYDETTDSLEALADELAEQDTGAGTGARTVTITVNDGVSVLQNAKVRMTEGVNTFTATTNVSGIAVFNMDDATYTVAVTKDGYTFAGTTLVVNGTEVATYSMTAIVITPATNPTQSTLSITCYDDSLVAEPGAIIRLVMVKKPDGDTGRAYDNKVKVLTANGSGIVTATVVRLAVYTIQRGDEITNLIRVTIPDAATCIVESVLGKEEL